MTVLAWDGEKLVADGRSTRGSELVSDTVNKFRKFDHPELGTCVAAFCGSVLTFEPWIEHIEQEGFSKFELPGEQGPMGSMFDASGVIITEDGEVIEIAPEGLWSTVQGKEAWGSGSTVAQHFLNTGYSALYAVEEACKTNITCGGQIMSYNIKTGEFKVEKTLS